MKKVHFKTFGCKTNQYETQAMREKLLHSGYVETECEAEADLFVVNTCTVTGESDRKNRAMIRKLHRTNPEAQIAVTGCYVALNKEEIARIPGVSFVIPNEEKDNIAQYVDIDSQGKFCGEGDESEENRYTDLSISYFADRARAFLKIQDGCDHSCTYCKVVIVRGASRSRPLQEIIDEAGRLVQNGYREVVLTGIQLGCYGDEWRNGISIVDVLEKLNEVEGLERIRLSSIDPSDVTDKLIEFMARNPKICRHLHLPLQSGDDTILKKMKRAYRTAHYLKIVTALRRALPDFSLTTDVMVGFPGEQEEHFQNTLDILEKTMPLKVHVFPFSPREGTRAKDFLGQVQGHVLRERVRRTQEFSSLLSQKYQEPYLGRVVEVISEGPNDEGFLEAHTANFLKVCFSGEGIDLGQKLNIRLSSLRSGFFLGEVVTN